jgi:hypothetical protein
MTARAPRAAPTPMPAFAPMDRPLCGEEGPEFELGADVGVLESTTDAVVVEAVEARDVLVAE